MMRKTNQEYDREQDEMHLSWIKARADGRPIKLIAITSGVPQVQVLDITTDILRDDGRAIKGRQRGWSAEQRKKEQENYRAAYWPFGKRLGGTR